MSCDNPILASVPDIISGDNQLKIWGNFLDIQHVYDRYRGLKKFVLLPCGHCVSCKLANARDWSRRVSDEISLLPLHQRSSFITLTYNDEHLPDGDNLQREDVQKFLKRLRLKVNGVKIRYFGCGEYGSKSRRAHYHLIFLGWSPDDLYFWSLSDKGNPIYRSPLLDEVWSLYDFKVGRYNPIGHVTVGDVVPGSVDYVCRYSLKKVQMNLSDKQVMPFTMCSSRPAIGLNWLKRYYGDCFKLDENGDLIRSSVPRYYRKKVYEMYPRFAEALDNSKEEYLYGNALLDPEEYLGKMEAHKIRASRFFGKNM